jgi:hypothetical protein
VSVEEEARVEARLEVWRDGALVEAFPLDDAETIIGRSSTSAARVDDERVSRQHAVVQRTGTAGWRIADLESTNGTFVNDQRVRAGRPLRDRDRIRVGDTELVFCGTSPTPETERRTVMGVVRDAPDVTRRERDVLAALCRPLFAPERYRLPATTREISAELVLSESAVRHHLDRLYDKFEIYDDDADERRRVLAVEAISRGVIAEP